MRPVWLGISAAGFTAAAYAFPKLAFSTVAQEGFLPSTDEAVPLDKLSCPLLPGARQYRPVVLVSCGSFNPPTNMHLRMFELARDHLTRAGFTVLGGYMSPVNDAYKKQELAPAKHRIAMAQAAVTNSSFIMVDSWEASQPTYQRSLHVLDRIQSGLQRALSGSLQPDDFKEVPVKAMLLCGSDLVESFKKPGVWKPEHLKTILGKHGVVCISRSVVFLKTGAQVTESGDGCSFDSQGIEDDETLKELQKGLIFVEEPVTNSVSSSLLRQQLAEGRSVRYLTPDGVIDYIHEHRLYRV